MLLLTKVEKIVQQTLLATNFYFHAHKPLLVTFFAFLSISSIGMERSRPQQQQQQHDNAK